MTATITDPDTRLAGLDLALEGRLVRPGDEDYEEARALWNGMIDARPAAIARVASAEDVAAAIRAARQAGLELAVRGGGHNVAGFGTVDEGLVIDLAALRSVSVDPVARRAVVGGGARLTDVDAATQAYGLAVPAGVVSDTGIAGLTLSGGLGWLRRRYGLTVDHLLAAELVTADGEILQIDEESDPELLWGLRGGGGNFGVVTSFSFQLQAVGPEVAFTFVFYPIEHARQVLAEHERIVMLEDEISTVAVLGHVAPDEPFPEEIHGEPFVGLLGMHAGPAEAGERAMQPLRKLASPLIDLSGPMPYIEAQQIYDADYPAGQRYYWKATNLPALERELIDLLVELTHAAPSVHSTIDVWMNGGAISRVPSAATAFADRDSLYGLTMEANWESPSEDEANVAWAREGLASLERYAADGLYLNFPGFLEEGQELVRASLGANYARLATLKARLDPENLFHRNANVEPAR